MESKILYIDIETSKDGKIKDVGALFNGQELHERKLEKLSTWIKEAIYICGHNIVKHDIPYLSKVLGEEIFRNKKIIDTLLWSPLLFSDNPYHNLVKGYKIVNDSEYNNPLSDCKLTEKLLNDELNEFDKLDESVKQIYASLLSRSKAYYGFLELIHYPLSKSEINIEVTELFKDKICNTIDLLHLIEHNPVELAYALALINTKENISILPKWVYASYPETQKILDQIRFTYCGETTCNYCSSNLNPKKALKKYFGYDDFRSFDKKEEISLQEKTVQAGLSSESFVAVFPTGGGKSLTFQLPALMKGELARQLTVVISPLISLMKDQVGNLKERFDINKAVAINGLLSPLERQEAIERVVNGDIHILYISPESLRSPTILRILQERSIARFVIDEAHCFSSWGQDFRVDYLYIPEFIKLLESERMTRIPVSCFTATAKPQVIDDIKKYFKQKLKIELDEYVTRASRENLSYEVISVENPDEKKKALLKLLNDCEKPAIIYASRTKRVEEIHYYLEKAGFDSTFFHGKLDNETKKENMDAFMKYDKEIIVATSAFGMGVDKDNVKSVIHFNISDSLENYIQEAGRAGRDENIKAKCYILFNEHDLNKHFSLLNQTKINRKEIQDIWRSLKYLSKYKNNNSICNSALEIAKKAGWDTEIRELETKVRTAISVLEDQGFLKRTLNSASVFADSLMVPKIDRALEKIHNCKSITEPQKQNCARILQRIVKDDVCRIDYIADRTGLKMWHIRECIDILRDLHILGDAKDLTAFINLSQNKINNSANILKRYLKIEMGMSELLTKDIKISIRQINQNLLDLNIENPSIDAVKNMLNYWEVRRFIRKERVDRANDLYHIKVKDYKGLQDDIKWRHSLAGDVYRLLEEFQTKQDKERKSENNKVFPVSFSMLELKNSNQILGQVKEEDTTRYEKTLLFLNQIKAIQLEGGFMVLYSRLNIEDIDITIPRFTIDNYEKLSEHYQSKIEQIHIVGEYAKKQLEKNESARAYVNDYFSLSYVEFLARYFPKRKTEIRTPLTKKRFQEISGGLDTDQAKIVNDNKSSNILVLAGPGSGKTKVLVHKIASLLLLEDIKPEQFLMLTFSKAASLEFKNRVRHLVPEYSGLIKITTFHGFCFQMLGKMGDLKKSENIIKEFIQAIENKEVDISSIVNKGVLLLDEFQDVNQEEWQLIQTIIKLAGDIRVIAVGDDDQNIYEFRGSDNKYMSDFKMRYGAVEYSLIKNYRSSGRIVQFNNELLKRIPHRLKDETLEANNKDSGANIKLTRYTTSYLEQSCAESVIQDNYNGTRAILVRTNKQALLLRTILTEMGQKTRLITGLESFSLDHLFELRSFTNYLKHYKNDAGLILDKVWGEAKKYIKSKHQASIHFEVCREVILKFEESYPDQKQLYDWYEYIREIRMEDAINPDASTIMISTMHKAKGKEFDHVYLLLEDYNFSSSESKRLVYVACSRAKKHLQIHCNSSFFDSFNAEGLDIVKYEGKTMQPEHFELVLNHKDLNLMTQKNFTSKRIKTLKSGDKLKYDTVNFSNNAALGLANQKGGNVLIFSKEFIEKKYNTFVKDGYELIDGNVEYLVYWFDTKEDKEYKIVLPKVRFSRVAEESGRVDVFQLTDKEAYKLEQ